MQNSPAPKVPAAILEKLQWNSLITKYKDSCQTDEGRLYFDLLSCNHSAQAVKENWAQVLPIKELTNLGYSIPIGEIPKLQGIFKAAKLGQILEGMQFRELFLLLESTKRVKSFASDFKEKCSTLETYHSQLYGLPKLHQALETTIGAEGEVLDEASKELAAIRRQIRGMRSKIEDKLKKILNNPDTQTYLQDDFFTHRNERFVIPIRLDGRGRVRGSIVDTSSSGQTLYIEPPEVAEQNNQLKELELAEKLEVIRILRDLSAFVAREIDTLVSNHTLLIQLDTLAAQGIVAFKLKANAVHIKEEPCLVLKEAHHPLLFLDDPSTSIANSIELSKEQSCLMISGPNAGGKTVVLKTVGLIHLMVKAGLLPPAHEESNVYLFEHIAIEMGDSQNLAASLSTFSGHLLGLRPVTENASPKSLVLLDEIAVGTEPRTGSAIAQATLEHVTARGAHCIVTTHYDALKGMAMENKKFRNGSMEYALATFTPTYHLILDLPGQSFGLELAKNLGFAESILDRATELKGQNSDQLDHVLNELAQLKSQSLRDTKELQGLKLEAQTAKARWEHETELLAETRKKTAERLKRRYEEEFEKKQKEMNEASKLLNQEAKKTARHNQEDVLTAKKAAKKSMADYAQSIEQLNQESGSQKEFPGHEASFADLKVGGQVFVIPLWKEGKISKIGTNKNEPVEINVGILKIRSSLSELRVYKKSAKPPKKPKVGKLTQKPQQMKINSDQFVMPTSSNSIDLRGMDSDEAVEKAWSFIDSALLRGDQACILIHGHGTAKLKHALRTQLARHCPYDVEFRAGQSEEGGDGVTVVYLKQ